jgi:hypothetical protein
MLGSPVSCPFRSWDNFSVCLYQTFCCYPAWFKHHRDLQFLALAFVHLHPLDRPAPGPMAMVPLEAVLLEIPRHNLGEAAYEGLDSKRLTKV